MVKIIINNTSEITALQVKLRALKAVLPRLQENASKDAASDILDIIHTKMRQNNFSEKIIDATNIGKLEIFGNKLRQHFISEFVADGFDVSKAREEGTASGIETKPKRPDGVLRWVQKTGEIIFRKSSRPNGIQRLLIMEKTTKQNKLEFQNIYTENLATSTKKVLGV